MTITMDTLIPGASPATSAKINLSNKHKLPPGCTQLDAHRFMKWIHTEVSRLIGQVPKPKPQALTSTHWPHYILPPSGQGLTVTISVVTHTYTGTGSCSMFEVSSIYSSKSTLTQRQPGWQKMPHEHSHWLRKPAEKMLGIEIKCVPAEDTGFP